MPNVISVEKAIEVLNQGEVVALPTETVYGLAAKIDNDSAIKKIFSTKQRPFFDPLIVHVDSANSAKKYASHWPESAEKLAQKFWPGPLTFVLRKTDLISPLITSSQDTVALRCPNHPIFLSVLQNLDTALAAPSANRFGKLSPTKPADVLAEFDNKVPVVDGDNCQIGIESTILDLTGSTPKILRPGNVTQTQLQEVLNTKVETIANSDDHPSPGSLAFHYQPDTPLVLIGPETSLKTIKASTLELPIPFSSEAKLELPTEAEWAARELYGKLRQLSDNNAYKIIYFQLQKNHYSAAWAGILNRLQKACQFSVVFSHGQLKILQKTPLNYPFV